MSSPTVNTNSSGTPLPALGTQTETLHLVKVKGLRPSIEPPSPQLSTPIEYESDVADDARILMQWQFNSPQVRYERDFSSGNMQITIDHNEIPALMGISHDVQGKSLHSVANHAERVGAKDSTETMEAVANMELMYELWGSDLMDPAFCDTLYLPTYRPNRTLSGRRR